MSNGEPGDEDSRVEGHARSTEISLSQALLAPLDAVFKAQIHAARSFLNLLLQLGYPHEPEPGTGESDNARDSSDGGDQRKKGKKGMPFMVDFAHEATVDGEVRSQLVRMPVLSLVPVSPLAVRQAEFSLEMSVKRIRQHDQMQPERAGKQQRRPWFLVQKPVSIEGVIAPPSEKGVVRKTRAEESSIRINVKVEAIPMPAGLDKLLTTLSQARVVEDDPGR